jgi:hypothetical protein
MVLKACVLVFCLSLYAVIGLVGSATVAQQQTLQYLQSELATLSAAQQNVGSFLRSKRISIGLPPGSLSATRKIGSALSRIAVSTEENPVECRVALGRAPAGAMCVAPCGCTGSQKWVQFAELNRLRRKEPDQWQVCRTCQQRLEYELFDAYGNLATGVLGFALDHRGIVRGSLMLALGAILPLLSIHLWVARVLTSRALWMKVVAVSLHPAKQILTLPCFPQFPQWSKIVSLPLPLKFWVGKLAVQYLWGRYRRWEAEVLVAGLADMEARMLEERLPAGESGDKDHPEAEQSRAAYADGNGAAPRE